MLDICYINGIEKEQSLFVVGKCYDVQQLII